MASKCYRESVEEGWEMRYWRNIIDNCIRGGNGINLKRPADTYAEDSEMLKRKKGHVWKMERGENNQEEDLSIRQKVYNCIRKDNTQKLECISMYV